ncbi:hypothetical protein GW7_13986, partial [Heterocephalus glaber]
LLAREDIDQAVRMILFRENHVVKRLDTYLQHLDIFKTRRKGMLYKKWVERAGDLAQWFRCLLRKRKDRSSIPGKPYSTKKLKETAKTSLRAKPPQFPFAVHSRPRREWRKASWGAVGSGTHCSCSIFSSSCDSHVCLSLQRWVCIPGTEKRVTAAPFAGSLFRRQQEADKEKRSGPEDGTGKPYSTKKLKETAKTSLRAKPPQFPFAVHSRPRREWRKASWGAVGSGTHCSCSPGRVTCAEKKSLPGEEETSDPSQVVFEGQFGSSRLSRGNPGPAKDLSLSVPDCRVPGRRRLWLSEHNGQGTLCGQLVILAPHEQECGVETGEPGMRVAAVSGTG